MNVAKAQALAEILACPARDLSRSPAALRVGQMAAESHLFMAHYEHRVQLPTPEHWNPTTRDDLGTVSSWSNGVLPEAKYAVFRHDMMLGSLHPMHRGKWTAHELCHGLLGFAWKPQGDILFNSLAARLAEILPVALWYFFDEERLRRCPKHHGKGPLGREFCLACEAAASHGPDEGASGEWMTRGVEFVQRELAAVKESMRTGELIKTPHDVVDLAADSVNYALAHAPRLASEEFEIFVSLFFNGVGGHHSSLESLEARVVEVMAGLVEGKDVASYSSSRWDWIGQDIGWRLLTVASECSDDIRDRLIRIVADLAERPGVDSVIASLRSYEEIVEEYEMPAAVEVFSVGYNLALGYGLSMRQICEGVISACPGTSQLLNWRGDDLMSSFLKADRPDRKPVGRRFAEFLQTQDINELATVAGFESALLYSPVSDNRWMRPDGSETMKLLHLAQSVDLMTADFDFVRLTDMLRQGRPGQPARNETFVAIARGEKGDSFIAEMPAELFRELQVLQQGARPRNEVRITEQELATLKECGLVEEI